MESYEILESFHFKIQKRTYINLNYLFHFTVEETGQGI